LDGKGTRDSSCLGVARVETQVHWVLQPHLAQDTWIRHPDPSLCLSATPNPRALGLAATPCPSTFGLITTTSPKL